MELAENFGDKNLPVYEYNGKAYRLAAETYIAQAIEKEELPEKLARVVSDGPLEFDENGILAPESDTNDMVSLADCGEWEKFARMFEFQKTFKVIIVGTKDFIGPVFKAGNQILNEGEILALVPKEAILEEKRYGWVQVGEDYDYGEGEYSDSYSLDLYRRLALSRTRGWGPVNF